LYHERNDPDPILDIESLRGLKDPPQWVPIMKSATDKEEVGRVFLWIDNFLLAGSSFTRLDKLALRLHKCATRMKWKFSEPDFGNTPASIHKACEPKKEVEYVGIHSFPLPGKNAGRAWKHLDKKYKKLRELRDLLLREDTHLTPRLTQCVVGNSIWDSMISTRRLHFVHPLIALSQDLIYMWDMPIEATQEQKDQLVAAVDAILESESRPYTNVSEVNLPSAPGSSMGAGGLVYACSDAELKQGGYVALNTESLSLCTAVTIEFPPEAEVEQWDINVKELWVAVVTINRLGSEDHHLVLGIDSTVARAWLRRGIASGEGAVHANRVLAGLNPKHRFTSLFFYSEDNLGDPTRNKTIIGEYARYRATVQILTGSHYYWNSVTDCPPPEAKLRNAKIDKEKLSSLELHRVKQSWDRWSNHGFEAGVVEDWSVLVDAAENCWTPLSRTMPHSAAEAGASVLTVFRNLSSETTR
jgi:hypothetical protein